MAPPSSWRLPPGSRRHAGRRAAGRVHTPAAVRAGQPPSPGAPAPALPFSGGDARQPPPGQGRRSMRAGVTAAAAMGSSLHSCAGAHGGAAHPRGRLAPGDERWRRVIVQGAMARDGDDSASWRGLADCWSLERCVHRAHSGHAARRRARLGRVIEGRVAPWLLRPARAAPCQASNAHTGDLAPRPDPSSSRGLWVPVRIGHERGPGQGRPGRRRHPWPLAAAAAHVLAPPGRRRLMQFGQGGGAHVDFQGAGPSQSPSSRTGHATRRGPLGSRRVWAGWRRLRLVAHGVSAAGTAPMRFSNALRAPALGMRSPSTHRRRRCGSLPGGGSVRSGVQVRTDPVQPGGWSHRHRPMAGLQGRRLWRGNGRRHSWIMWR